MSNTKKAITAIALLIIFGITYTGLSMNFSGMLAVYRTMIPTIICVCGLICSILIYVISKKESNVEYTVELKPEEKKMLEDA